MATWLGKALSTFFGRWFGTSEEVPAEEPKPVSSGRPGTGLFLEPDPLRVVVGRVEIPAPVAEVRAAVLEAQHTHFPTVYGYEPAEAMERVQAKAFTTAPAPEAGILAGPSSQASIIYYMSLPLAQLSAAFPRAVLAESTTPLPFVQVLAEPFGHIDDEEMESILAAIMAEDEAA